MIYTRSFRVECLVGAGALTFLRVGRRCVLFLARALSLALALSLSSVSPNSRLSLFSLSSTPFSSLFLSLRECAVGNKQETSPLPPPVHCSSVCIRACYGIALEASV